MCNFLEGNRLTLNKTEKNLLNVGCWQLLFLLKKLSFCHKITAKREEPKGSNRYC